MNKRDLEELIWNTRRDFFNYLTEHKLTVRSIEESYLIQKQAFKEMDKLGIQTETEYNLILENEKLKKEVELLKESIKLLKQ